MQWDNHDLSSPLAGDSVWNKSQNAETGSSRTNVKPTVFYTEDETLLAEDKNGKDVNVAKAWKKTQDTEHNRGGTLIKLVGIVVQHSSGIYQGRTIKRLKMKTGGLNCVTFLVCGHISI
ncbi:hypothetical protein M9H77_03413 [Catharanthus roseus]|uniref:Uncharacterized protein n=1 Tax=Catharanthus roseus TaxID=4058 RepID=A0ACC0CBC6_CATRO|nr:hypothetical protein M9H77_03413 [Catharanthus roseus]